MPKGYVFDLCKCIVYALMGYPSEWNSLLAGAKSYVCRRETICMYAVEAVRSVELLYDLRWCQLTALRDQTGHATTCTQPSYLHRQQMVDVSSLFVCRCM